MFFYNHAMKLWQIMYSGGSTHRDTPERSAYNESLRLMPHTHGVIIIDTDEGLDETVYRGIRDRYKHAEIVVMYACNPKAPNYTVLKRLLGYTDLLSLGVGIAGEFHGGAQFARSYIQLAQQLSFHWCPTIVPKWACQDVADGGGQLASLIHNHCPHSFSLAHYVYWAFAHEHPELMCEVPDLDSYHVDAFSRVPVGKMRQWVKKCGNMIAGAGYQQGLDAGTMDYAKIYGFTGMVVRPPVTLTPAQMATFDEIA